MKLIHKLNLFNILILLFSFAAGSIVFYYTLSGIFEEEMEEQLEHEMKMFSEKIAADSIVLSSFHYMGDNLRITSVNSGFKNYFTDSLTYNSDGEEVLNKVLCFPVLNEGKYYRISVSKPYLESEDLAETIFVVFIYILLGLLAALLIVNSWISAKLWKPYYGYMEELEKYDVQLNNSIKLQATTTKEFSELKTTLEKLTSKFYEDYKSQKEFSENASHEMQTPLAVLSSKLELLLQEKGLSKDNVEIVEKCLLQVYKLSKIIRSLLLIAKIENKQFKKGASCDVSKVVLSKVELYKDMYQDVATFIVDADSSVHAAIDESLVEILVNNLIGNAVKYSDNKKIYIELKGKKFTVKNTSLAGKIDDVLIFKRFGKMAQTGDSSGLGLAIVKKICESYGLTINYSFEDNFHVFSLGF